MSQWTVASVLEWTEGYFRRRALSTPRLDAEVLLAYSLGMKDRLGLYLHHDRPLTELERESYRKLVKSRGGYKPAAYIIGKKEFYTIDLDINENVLVPRPDTETLVDAAVNFIRLSDSPLNVVDAGCGSGAIAISIKKFTNARVVAVDISMKACEITIHNAEKNDLKLPALNGDMLSAIKPASVDVVVSNPPYIKSDYLDSLNDEPEKFPAMAREVSHEPRQALDGGADGFEFYRNIAVASSVILKPGGAVFVEAGRGQHQKVKQIFSAAGLNVGGTMQDLSGIERVIWAKK